MKTLPWLLRREFWENKGGFFWAPVITAAIFFTFTLMALIGFSVFKNHFMGDVHIGVSLRQLTDNMSHEQLADVGKGLNVALAMLGNIIQVVLFFVVFFYLLGALYDDRRDRSVLFWKSLPISDRDTVLSKVISAAFVAPLIALAVLIALQLAFLLLLSVYCLFYGINPLTMIWGAAAPFTLWSKMLILLPINALWALPTMGWLLLVSAFFRSKPLLWAILLPVGAALLINWFDILSSFNIPDTRFWKYGVARLLAGVFPGAYQIEFGIGEIAPGVHVAGAAGATTWTQIGQVLTSPSLWLGAIAGVVMLFGATRLRRWRDEA